MKMETYIDNKVTYYSKGMKQKLMLLIALINMPALVIMDEPLNGLDMESVCVIEDVIHSAAKERKTSFLITSHDKFFIDEVCTVKYKINDKRLSLVGNEDTATTRTMTIFFEANDFPEHSVIEKNVNLIDAKRKMYGITFGINNAEVYHEISKCISERLFKIISVSL